MPTYFPGTRVLIFDARLYKDDRRTPLSVTMQPATVLRWYGKTADTKASGSRFGPYPSLVDVRFDRDGRESRGHFAGGTYARVLDTPKEGG